MRCRACDRYGGVSLSGRGYTSLYTTVKWPARNTRTAEPLRARVADRPTASRRFPVLPAALDELPPPGRPDELAVGHDHLAAADRDDRVAAHDDPLITRERQ